MATTATDGLTTEQWLALPPTDPRSPLYEPPAGMYQNDAGQLVPKSQINTPDSFNNELFNQSLPFGASSILNSISPSILAGTTGGTKATGGAGHTVEDWITILVGLILIAAGVFAFKTTQTVIETGGRVARRGAEGAAAIAAL